MDAEKSMISEDKKSDKAVSDYKKGDSSAREANLSEKLMKSLNNDLVVKSARSGK